MVGGGAEANDNSWAVGLWELTTVQWVSQNCLIELVNSSISDVSLISNARATKKYPAYAWQGQWRQLELLITPVSALHSRYQKISGDGRLLHSVEGALLRGAGLEVEYGLHYCLAAVRVPASHHEEVLVRVVTLRFLGARCFVNGWGRYAGVKALRVAGVGNVGRVWGGLRTEENVSKTID